MTRAANDRYGQSTESRPQSAVAAAEQLLAGTADTVNPGTPAPVLLACLAQYRAHLAALVAASRDRTG